MDMNWSEFITHLLDVDLRLSTVDVEKMTGIRSPIIGRWKNGFVGKPQRNTVKRLEEGLKIRIDDSDPANITYKKITLSGFENEIVLQNKYPLLSEIQAGVTDTMLRTHTGEFVFFVYKKSEGCFALQIVGDSMKGTFNEGDVILVDINAELANGCIVAIKLKDGRKMVKRYREIGQGYYMLYSDNTSYDPLTIHASEIEAIYRVVMRLHTVV